MRELDRDPAILSVPEAAALMGVAPRTIRDQLRDDEIFRAAVRVVIGRQQYVSRIRLERYLHGAAS